MFKYFTLLSTCLLSVFPVYGETITKIKTVERLCYQQSEDILEEQGISLIKWQSESFNGDQTFNIEGKWLTNGGDYIVECELPFGSNASVLTVELTKI
jgi:hypothetical protein